jgi:anti-anti-sigma regulatory factor
MAGIRTGTQWCVTVVCLMVLAAGAARACDDDDGDGLDVGLVLSGGGALATTHVGALTAIESLGIPIHGIVGTSMGSVVGAMYAAGYDAEALRAVFRDSRWPEVFSGHIGRRDEPFLRKEQDDLYFSGYVAGERILLFEFTGPLSFGAAADLGHHVREHSRPGSRVLILDFSRVPFLDVSAVMAVQNVAEDARRYRRLLFFTGMNEVVRETLETLSAGLPGDRSFSSRLDALRAATASLADDSPRPLGQPLASP